MTALPAPQGASPPADAVRPGTLRVSTEALDNGVVLQVAGEVDMETAPILAQHLTAAIKRAAPGNPVVVDLNRVQFFSSNGLSVLLNGHAQCADRSATLLVVADHRAVLRPIQATGLSDILSIHPTVEAALTANA
jgi:anti-sigma B factor antagonist